LDSITRMEQLSYENRAINKDNTLTPSIENENITIDISGVSYKYNDEMDWVINELSLEIRQGEKNVILGKSGTGKSTLLKMLAGIIQPQEGSIRLNGVRMEQEYLGKLVSVLNQKAHLFHTT